jgi:hypothetical protein
LAIRVSKVGDIVGREILIPAKGFKDNQLPAVLTNLDGKTDGPRWQLLLEIGEKANKRSIIIDLEPWLSALRYENSKSEPLLISPEGKRGDFRQIFLFRDRFFQTERPIIASSDNEEAILRIKKYVYDEEGQITALRSYVSNIEAAEEYQRSGPRREPIPDDVKLLVWSRDGGACTRCGSGEKLHFDHIIPVVKGGGNDSNNIQLLCQVCNLKKSDKIAF